MSDQQNAELAKAAFARYADWYDLFYTEKNYEAEADYILAKVRGLCQAFTRWLDVGCGTGRHLTCLQAKGIAVEGVDASQTMIGRARLLHPEIPFHVGRAQDLTGPADRDVVTMLFHVMNYQTSDDLVRQSMKAVAKCLKPGGIFAFDFWNSDGVTTDPPSRRLREVLVDRRVLWRVSTPEMRPVNRIDVRYEFRWDSPTGELAHRELHALRHYSRDELEGLLRESGFKLLTCEGWMQDRPLTRDDWYGFICARREGDSQSPRAQDVE